MTYSMLSLLMPLLVVGLGGYRYLGSQGSAGASSEDSQLWAARRGFMPTTPPAGGATPTLELPGGEAHDCVEVPIAGATGALYTWTWVIADDRGPEAQMFDIPAGLSTGEATVVQALISAGFPHFRVVPKRGFVAPNGEASEQELHLESAEFGKHFRLLAGPDGDHQALMRLFSPEMIVWFTDLGDIAPVVEYWMGTLVVCSRVACCIDDEYDALLDAAQRMARLVIGEGVTQRPSLA